MSEDLDNERYVALEEDDALPTTASSAVPDVTTFGGLDSLLEPVDLEDDIMPEILPDAKEPMIAVGAGYSSNSYQLGNAHSF